MLSISKINKINDEIIKTKTKISDYQIRLRELERQKIDAENSEIVNIVRRNNITAKELIAVLQEFKSSDPISAIKKQEELKNDN